MNENINKNFIPIAIIIAAFLIIGAIFYTNQQEGAGGLEILSMQEVGEKVINYINKNILEGQATASLGEIKEENGLYKMIIKIGDQEFPSYASRDGELLFPEAIQLEEKESPQEQETTKTEKPDVKLFIMSYCPYGLQAQKMFLPVYNLLKDKAEMGVYFVNYIMHEKKEIDENLRQYCIQKEEKEKYYNYLNCFVKDGNSEKCLLEAKIDKDRLENCIGETDQTYKIYSQYEDKNTWLNGYYPKFDLHSELNEQYGVKGSPTAVINGKIVEVSPRSPQNFKEIVCQNFNSKPSECDQELSDSAFSPGFGLETGDAQSENQCK